jgi:hypothetical protein
VILPHFSEIVFVVRIRVIFHLSFARAITHGDFDFGYAVAGFARCEGSLASTNGGLDAWKYGNMEEWKYGKKDAWPPIEII